LKLKKAIVLVGPTASGKTSLAIELAEYFKTSIISADSRQCYAELNIGVARPSARQLLRVPHYFIASESIKQELSAASFATKALKKAHELFEKHDIIIVTGGTGLYIKAFCEGLDEIPGIDPDIRKIITADFNDKGLAWLQNELREKDPLFAEKGEMQNPQRMMRALEVITATGQSITSFWNAKKTDRSFAIEKYGIDIPKETLDNNIDDRVDQMIIDGLVEEARLLIPYAHLNPLRTVGYSELFEYFNGKLDLDNAIEWIKVHTRQYAKRQLTWFRKDQEIEWGNEANEIATKIRKP
jgi:tRNA dimethylallyltransferase